MKEYIRDGRSPIPKNDSISKVMSSNKGKNTKPELNLRKVLWKVGLRGYRIHWKKMPGRPDIVFTKKRLAIFVNGCYWHRCPHCKLSLPKTNLAFWEIKFNVNKERDKQNIIELEKLGWKVLVVWECQLKEDIDKVISTIKLELS